MINSKALERIQTGVLYSKSPRGAGERLLTRKCGFLWLSIMRKFLLTLFYHMKEAYETISKRPFKNRQHLQI